MGSVLICTQAHIRQVSTFFFSFFINGSCVLCLSRAFHHMTIRFLLVLVHILRTLGQHFSSFSTEILLISEESNMHSQGSSYINQRS